MDRAADLSAGTEEITVAMLAEVAAETAPRRVTAARILHLALQLLEQRRPLST